NSNALLKSIQLVPLSESSATVVLVISTGEVFSKMIYLNTSKNEIEDLRIAIRLFKERLVDVPIYQLAQRALSLK
ncbi:heat-inducible transcriptional repressor HrcA, partial [Mycoplasmopsis pullorum]